VTSGPSRGRWINRSISIACDSQCHEHLSIGRVDLLIAQHDGKIDTICRDTSPSDCVRTCQAPRSLVIGFSDGERQSRGNEENNGGEDMHSGGGFERVVVDEVGEHDEGMQGARSR